MNKKDARPKVKVKRKRAGSKGKARSAGTLRKIQKALKKTLKAAGKQFKTILTVAVVHLLVCEGALDAGIIIGIAGSVIGIAGAGVYSWLFFLSL